MSLTSHLIRDLLTEQAGGLDDQDDNQQREREGIGEGGQTVAGMGDAGLEQDDVQTLDQVFANADDECTHHSAGNGADTAEHGRNEGFQAGHSARGLNNGVVVGKVQD